MEQLKNDFKAFESQLNGEGKTEWHGIRKKAFDSFVENGFPSVKNEEYKYTHIGRAIKKCFDSDKLNVIGSEAASVKKSVFQLEDAIHIYVSNGIVNKEFIPEIAIDGVELMTIKDAFKQHQALVLKHLGNHLANSDDPFAALNTAFSYEGVFIKVDKNHQLKRPIIIHYQNDTEVASNFQSRNLILIEKGADAKILEVFSNKSDSESFTNHVSEIAVAENAHLKYYKLQEQGNNSYHVDNTLISQARDSNVTTFTISLEGKIIRNNLNFSLEDEKSEAHMFGLYVAHGESHIDNHTSVDHKVPNCFSNEVYKGILDNNSKGVFNGKIFVRPDAQKTNAFQSNKNILLSDTATINTKPQLEIWADDVSCSHGCTTGQLDDEQLFYLRSRGIGKSKARAMLLHAFVNDVLDKIEIGFLKEYIDKEMYNRLDL